eukprot:TRINITY_DN81186_c0_g1_i1.p1 TRINITY_DN81186_c0_g1~~TRINITY_DN81186_c0_g1_i1.p1  ORF type:complete len:547 (-),score=76.81 TRINITY_DN81186_c0_g1_i1:42-1682(-)
MSAIRALLLLLVGLCQVSAQITSGGLVSITTPGYVTGDQPTQMVFTFTPTLDVKNTGDQISITADAAIFAADGPTTDYAVSDAGGSPGFVSGVISGSGTVLTLTMSSVSGAQGKITKLVATTVTVGEKALGLLPTPGLVSVIIFASGNAAQTGIGTFTVVPAPTITLTTPNYNVGSQPTQLQIVWTSPLAVADADLIKVSPRLGGHTNLAVFIASVTTGLTIAGTAVSSGSSTFTYTTSTSMLTLTKTGGTMAVGDTLDITIPVAALATLPSNGIVLIDIVYDSSGTETPVVNDASGFGTIVLTGGSGNDPVARFGNVSHEFELPVGVLMPLVTTPDLEIHGSVFQGGGPWEQWFDRFVLMSPDHSRYLDMRMKPNIHEQNHSQKSGLFRTLEVTLGYGRVESPTATTEVSSSSTRIPFSFLDNTIVFRDAPRGRDSRFSRIGNFPRECVEVAGGWLHFSICSTPAAEYFSSGYVRHLALKYAHLDLLLLDVSEHSQLTGFLPELWGIQPMSESSRAYLKDQTVAACNANQTENGSDGASFKVCST